MTLTVKNYHYPAPLELDTPNRVEFYPITMNTWPGNPITFHSLIVNDRRSSISRINKFPTDYLTTSTVCALSHVGTLSYGYFGVKETYNFKFICPSKVPIGGEYIIYFPLEFVNGLIDPTTCVFGNSSIVNITIGATCMVFRGTELHIKGFTSAIPVNSLVDMNISVTNPAQGSYSNPYTASRFVIATYNSTSLIKGNFTVIDRNDPAGTAWLTDPANRSFNPPKVSADNSSLFYHEGLPLSNPGTGPIQFSISSPVTISKKTGYLLLSIYETISLATNSEIRCVWQHAGNEYLADDCIFTPTISSNNPSTIQMFAPTSFNVTLNTLYTVYITTVFANQKIEGFVFGSGLVRYGFLAQIFAYGGTTVTSGGRAYLEMVGMLFPNVSITADQ